MNHINNTNGGAASRAQPVHGLVNNEGKWLLPRSRGVQWRINRRVKPFASWIVYYALLFSLCVSVRAGLLKPDVAFSNDCGSHGDALGVRNVSCRECSPGRKSPVEFRKRLRVVLREGDAIESYQV